MVPSLENLPELATFRMKCQLQFWPARPALKVLATGGVYITSGVALHVLNASPSTSLQHAQR
jgi:hypothetical protein